MPRRISAEEAARLGAVPVEAPLRKMTLAEAQAAGAAPVEDPDQQGLGAWLARTFDPKTKAGTALRGFGQGASLGLSDEMAAGAGANIELLSHLVPGMEERYPDKSIIDATLAAYRGDREGARRDLATGRAVQPEAAAASEMAGAMALPVRGVKGMVGTGAGYGLGTAEGDVGGQLKRALMGGGLGLAGAGIAKGLGAGLGYVGRKAGEQAGLAAEATKEAERIALEKLANSARGALGGEMSTAARTLEQAERAIVDPVIDPAVKKAAEAFLASPEATALRNKVVQGSVERGAGQLGRVEGAAQKYAEASTDIPGRAASQAAAKLDPATAAKDLGGKAWRSLGQRALLGTAGAAGGALLGGVVGGPVGGGIGATMGSVGLGSLAPGALQFLRNTAKSPVVQSLANRATEGAMEVAVPVAERTAGAATRNPSAYAALQSLMEPERQKKEAEDAMAAADRGTPK